MKTAFAGHALLLALALFLPGCGGSGGGGSGGDNGDGNGPDGNPVDISQAETIEARITDVAIGSPPVVSFTLADENDNGVVNLPATALSLAIAKLTPGTDGNPNAWQSYLNTLDAGKAQATIESGSAGALVDNKDGSYIYTFATDVTNVTTPIPVSYNASLSHRVTFEIRGFAQVANPNYDFRPSNNATSGILTRDIAVVNSCNVCHENLAYHGEARNTVQNCVTCHNPGSIDGQTGNTLAMPVMTHKIHMGASLPSVQAGGSYCLQGISLKCYDDVVYPQDIRNCRNCHDENNPATPDAKNWFREPSEEACGSCHDDVNFQTGENHAEDEPGQGIVASNSLCSGCHVGDGSSLIEVRNAHRIVTQELAGQYRLNILTTTPAAAGSTPTVDFSVTDPTSGNTPYDLDTEEVRSVLSGLRFIMGWNTADYTNAGYLPNSPPRTDLYVNGVLQADLIDPGIYQITLDQTEQITAGTQGSGAVTFEGKGSRDGLNLPITSAVDFFAITDATPVPRRQKVDLARCNECHQLLSQHGANRNDNLDNCLICHNPPAWSTNQSRSFDMALMAHRLHLEGRYPQRISNCKSCHTDTGFYPTPANSGILAKSTSTGDDNTDPTDDSYITPNSATCSVACHNGDVTRDHMEQFGGVFDAFLNASGEYESQSSGRIANEICTVCHAPGASHDVARVHGLE